MSNKYNLDLSIIPRELRLLLEIIKIEHANDSKVLLKSELFSNINWDKFVELARYHRIFPLIYSKLKQIDKELFPARIYDTVYHEYKANTFKMLQLSGEMGRISKLFAESQINLLFLKGPIIAEEIYGDISLRTSKDLDILIPITDLKKAQDLLQNYGYIREDQPPPKIYERLWGKQHVSFFNPQKGIEIEIHWRLHPPPAEEPGFKELWERKRVSRFTTYPVYFLGEEDLFLFLIDHGNRHSWFRLRWLVDIDQIIRKRGIPIQNTAIINRTRIKRGAEFLRVKAILLAALLLNTPIDKEIISLLEMKRSKKFVQLATFSIVEMGNLNIGQSQSAVNYEPHKPISVKSNIKKSIRINWYAFSMRLHVHKILFLMRLLYPNSEDEKVVRIPKPFHFLYFPLRPVLWGWRKLRK